MVNYITKAAATLVAFEKQKLNLGLSLKGPFIAILAIYVLMIVLPYFTSYIILLIQAFSDKPDIVDKSVDKMIKLFTLAASESTILAAAFIAGFAVDTDNDKIPDSMQDQGKYSLNKEKKEPKEPPHES
ncbi:MAG: hypothetical protein IJ193_00720 [Bacilli bacterium]|nr:hypothetical protein [Bacilli bacterium]